MTTGARIGRSRSPGDGDPVTPGRPIDERADGTRGPPRARTLRVRGRGILYVGCLLVQVFLVGLDIFADSDASIHRDFAYVYGWLTPVLVLLAGFAEAPKSTRSLTIVLVVLFAIQIVLLPSRRVPDPGRPPSGQRPGDLRGGDGCGEAGDRSAPCEGLPIGRPSRERMAAAVRRAAVAYLVGIVIQVLLAGAALFDMTDFKAHVGLGWALGSAPIVLLPLAIAARAGAHGPPDNRADRRRAAPAGAGACPP